VSSVGHHVLSNLMVGGNLPQLTEPPDHVEDGPGKVREAGGGEEAGKRVWRLFVEQDSEPQLRKAREVPLGNPFESMVDDVDVLEKLHGEQLMKLARCCRRLDSRVRATSLKETSKRGRIHLAAGQAFWKANSPSGSRSDLRHPSATTAVMRATPAAKASSEIAARSEYVRDLTFDRYSMGDSATGCSTV
jgi:hypothetical protein